MQLLLAVADVQLAVFAPVLDELEQHVAQLRVELVLPVVLNAKHCFPLGDSEATRRPCIGDRQK